MLSHDRFRELSALAAIGQLSSDENQELTLHLRECASCRQAHEGYAHVVLHQLPKADAIRWRLKSSVSQPPPDAELRERFFARARSEGVELSPEAERPRSLSHWPWQKSLRLAPVLSLASMAALILVGIWVSAKYQLVPRGPRIEATRPVRPENAEVQQQLTLLEEKIARDASELARLTEEKASTQQSLKKLEQELEEARATEQQLSTRLEQATSEKAGLSAATQEKDSAIADLRAKNEKIRRENAENLAERIVLESKVRELDEAYEQKSANLERERQLMTVSRDVRQLIGARNLRILDVHDVDGGGKSAKAFGRVFYAENQSLIFYAFDLPSGKLAPAKYTFQAWGQREYVANSVRNLGSFEVDDHEQRRWVLKVTDPALLQNIDSVFVTAEALADRKEPHGKKLLYAYIVGQANHP